MPETETVLINGNPVIIEKMITSGDLLVSTLITIMTTVLVAFVILHFFYGGKR